MVRGQRNKKLYPTHCHSDRRLGICLDASMVRRQLSVWVAFPVQDTVAVGIGSRDRRTVLLVRCQHEAD